MDISWKVFQRFTPYASTGLVIDSARVDLAQGFGLAESRLDVIGEGLSFVTTRIILGIVFFLIVTPIGVVKRLSGWDPLERRSGRRSSYWKPYSERQRDPRHYEKMF